MSSTMMIAPLASSSLQSSIARKRRGFTPDRYLIAQAKSDDTRHHAARRRENVAEIQIECQSPMSAKNLRRHGS